MSVFIDRQWLFS